MSQIDNDPDYQRLPDESDMATRREEQFLAAFLEEAKRVKPVLATGYCLDPDCGEQLASDAELAAAATKGLPDNARRFCNAECRDMYERHLRMRRIAGRT